MKEITFKEELVLSEYYEIFRQILFRQSISSSLKVTLKQIMKPLRDCPGCPCLQLPAESLQEIGKIFSDLCMDERVEEKFGTWSYDGDTFILLAKLKSGKCNYAILGEWPRPGKELPAYDKRLDSVLDKAKVELKRRAKSAALLIAVGVALWILTRGEQPFFMMAGIIMLLALTPVWMKIWEIYVLSRN